MKLHLLAIAALCATPVLANAEVGPVSLRVEQISKNDPGKFTTKQEKSLKIFLANSSVDDLAKLNVKYWFFGRRVKADESSVVNKGAMPAAVKAHGSTIVETPIARATFTEEHFTEVRAGGKNQNHKNAGMSLGKKVPASGEKLTGFGVQVFEGEKLLAESFSEPGLREKVGGAAKN